MTARESARFTAGSYPLRRAARAGRGRACLGGSRCRGWRACTSIRPCSRDGSGSRFRDVDGHEYVDMYLGDMSVFCGHAPPPVVEAVGRRMAAGNHFLLPGEDAIVVAEHLATPLSPATVAVHAVRNTGEHRGDPDRASAHGPRGGADVRRQVPRPRRRHPGRHGGRPDGPQLQGPRLLRRPARPGWSRSTT